MNRTLCLPLAILAATLSLLLGSVAASPAIEQQALALADPRTGDAALYQVHQVREGPKGTVTVDGRIFMEWTAEDVRLSGGVARMAPTLRSSVVGDDLPDPTDVALFDAAVGTLFAPFTLNPGKDYAAEDPIIIRERAIHLSSVPGPQEARSVVWTELATGRDTPRAHWSQRVEYVQRCDLDTPEAVIAALAGRDGTQARKAVDDCDADVTEAEDGTWTIRSPRLLLVVDLDGGRRSMPRSIESDATQGKIHVHTEASMVGWREGDGGLAAASFPPVPSSVPLVEWTARGPAEGDLRVHPFRDAHAALESKTDQGRAFFPAHPEARILFATHAWNGLDSSPAGDPWESRVKGVRCDPAPTQAAQSGEWKASWVANKASMFAVTQRQPLEAPSDALSGGSLERPIGASLDDYGTANSGLPATRAPAPQQVADRLHDIDAFQPQGVYSIDYAFIPTAHGNIQGAAAVSRGTCRDDPTMGSVVYEGSSIWFIEGRPTALVTTSIQRARPSVVPAFQSSDLDVPAARDVPALPLIAGATLLVGGAAAVPIAPRLLGAAYTRIAKNQVLSHPLRKRLFEAVGKTPGLLLGVAAKQLGVPRNTLDHHLRILRRHGFVATVRAANGLRIFPANDVRSVNAKVMLKSHAPNVLQVVLENPGLTQDQIATRSGVQKTHLSGMLRHMETGGLVERRREGRRVHVTARPGAETALAPTLRA